MYFAHDPYNFHTMGKDSIKQANPDHPIHELIAKRWSPYAFDSAPVAPEQLKSCLEAARWAASSFNEQPWSFIIATRDDETEFDRLINCLMEANQEWARNTGVLILTVIQKRFTRNDKPNRVAEHDLGLAIANLTTQAVALGVAVHQMAGVNLSKARQTYAIPDTHEPMTVVALGYAADPSQFEDESLARRDLAPRSRKPLSDFVFTGGWGQTAQVVSGPVGLPASPGTNTV